MVTLDADWPHFRSRIVALGRAEGTGTAQAFADVVETGLEALEDA